MAARNTHKTKKLCTPPSVYDPEQYGYFYQISQFLRDISFSELGRNCYKWK